MEKKKTVVKAGSRANSDRVVGRAGREGGVERREAKKSYAKLLNGRAGVYAALWQGERERKRREKGKGVRVSRCSIPWR